MPLLDHFRPPLSRERHWDSFHAGWAEAMARHLNESLLPDHFVAEARVNIGGRVEIDVAAFAATGGAASENGAVAVWAPPQPTLAAPLDFANLDLIEVQVFRDDEGPRLVAAIELVSPANKDRPSHRRMFIAKCAALLQEGVGLAVIDVVTQRRGNLHAELLDFLNVNAVTPGQADDLYAAAYRTTAADPLALEIWSERLALGAALPTLPLWIGPDLAVPLDLEWTYRDACAARRIELDDTA
jgi:hypothetical protein